MKNEDRLIRYIDLFCGIGGFRLAVEKAAESCDVRATCVFSCDTDKNCQKTYEANFGERPFGDITSIDASDVPDHEILLAGFPCQPFSVIGKMRGFEDSRGGLFFEIARILKAKKPRAFLLENVKLLAGHNKGQTLKHINNALEEIGYNVAFKILNAMDFGLPQKRERIFIAGFKDPVKFQWPERTAEMTPLERILENNVDKKYYVSSHILRNRSKKLGYAPKPSIWHENKSGHVSAYPFSCALRAGASYNYLLVNGERRFTPREMLRLQGFPDTYKIVCSYSQTRKQAGNSLPVPVATAILKNMFVALGWAK